MKRALVLAGILVLAAPALSGCFGGPATDWAYKMTGIRTLQGQGYDGSGIRVAIIDTGLRADHPSLDHVHVVAWKDYVNGRAQPYDDVGHGSHVAGVIVAKGASLGAQWQGYDLKGAAPKADLIVVKAISADGTGESQKVADGITFAVQNRADIICLSLGSRSNAVSQFVGDEITDAVKSAINQGILVVAAAGNTGEDDSRDDVESPATIEGVIAVGAVDRNKVLAAFSAHGNDVSNHGPLGNDLGAQRSDPHKKPELVAPGVDIRSAWAGKKGEDYAEARGTSQAAPFVCGALALLLQAKPNLRNTNSDALTNQVKNALMNTAEKVDSQRRPHDNTAGYGLLRADLLVGKF